MQAATYTESARSLHLTKTEQDAATRRTLERYVETRDAGLRDELVRRYDRVVQWVVNRQAREGMPTEDLLQVGRLALLQALERYQPSRGVQFTSYAIKVISGKLKHYFRDRASLVRVPRPIQDLAASLPRLQEELVTNLGRLPSCLELSERAGVSETAIREALGLSDSLKIQSLDDSSDEQRALQETLGNEDPELYAVVEHAPLYEALDSLEQRQQMIMRRRYFDLWSQAKVATSLGISQMHVSRLERDGLRRLRTMMMDPDTGAAGNRAMMS